MKETLSEINALREAGVIGQSAIGGAMGATFYLEPVSTFDLDIFVLFAGSPLILTLSPIYDFLNARGHIAEGDAIVIHGWPVQFLPAETPLLRAAKAAGCRTASGLGMLLHQGAQALEIWSGQPAPVAVMRRALEQNIYGH